MSKEKKEIKDTVTEFKEWAERIDNTATKLSEEEELFNLLMCDRNQYLELNEFKEA